MKPLLKWTGGKRQYVQDIQKHLAPGQRLIEAFVGGGALFFGHNGRGVINDANCELINFYREVERAPLELVRAVRKIPQNELAYYHYREQDRRPDFKDIRAFDRATRMLYLNKCAFNGMWRENKSGFHNVPWNKKPGSGFPSDDEMLAAQRRLSQVRILCGDFEDACSLARPGDFVYLDPPYVTSTFTSYASGGFGWPEMERLAKVALTLDQNKVNVCISNLGAQAVLELFPSDRFKVEHLKGKKHIFAANPAKRGAVDEVLIVNVNS